MRMEEKKRKAVIGLGANLGEREETIRRALEAVNALPGTKVLPFSAGVSGSLPGNRGGAGQGAYLPQCAAGGGC